MKLKFTDYNNPDQIVSRLWPDVVEAIEATSLRLKGSDQEGIQGNPIFDPVGTNSALKDALSRKGWDNNVVIPSSYKFLGKDVDFEKDGVILEVQFSNYPFLLNNVVRTYLFNRQDARISGAVPQALIVITKCKIFPASNSTLYYEQGKNQLDVLATPDVFNLPIRLVGLSEDQNTDVPCVFTTYNKRYSRTPMRSEERVCKIRPGGARARLSIV